MNKGHSTQWLANTYPLWSKIRNDHQSAGFQFLNPIGLRTDDLRRQGERIGANIYLPTSIVSDIDVYYKFRLPRNFEFTADSDDTEFLFSTPTVSGLIDTTYYDITLAEDNNIEGFWYNAVPDRIGLGETVNEPVGGHLVVSGHISQSPFLPLVPSGIIAVPNHLTVTLSGADLCIDSRDGFVSFGQVQIEGVTRAGQHVTEDLTFLYDETLTTLYEYAEVSGVRAYAIEDADDAFLVVTSSRLANREIGEDMYYKSAYDLAYNTLNFQDPYFWTVASGAAIGSQTQHTLELHKYEGDDPEIRLDGWTSKSLLTRFELLDANDNHIAPVDMAVERWSQNLWVATSGVLYLFDDSLPYPDTSLLVGKKYDAASVIATDYDTVVSGETIDIDCIWERPTVGMVAHRTWVEKPDGTKYSLEAGEEAVYHNDAGSWVLGEPYNRKIKPTETYTLDQRGDYVFSLETKYTDSTSHLDKRIISVLYKKPRASFPLQDIIGAQNQVYGIDIDSENKLWLFDQNGHRHQINFHYDIMLIDLAKKILYFREPYSEVRVWND